MSCVSDWQIWTLWLIFMIIWLILKVFIELSLQRFY